MKRRHYPLATIGFAFLLTVAPLLLLTVSLGMRDDNVEFVDQPTQTPARQSAQSDVPLNSKPVAVSADPGPSTRLVMATTSPLPLKASANEKSAPAAQTTIEDMATLPVPLSDESPDSALVPQPLEIVDYRDSMDGPLLNPEHGVPDSELAAAELPELPRRPPVTESYYQATGHLAMANQPRVPDLAGPEAAPAQRSVQNDSDSPAKKPSENRRGRKSKDEPKKPEATDSLDPDGSGMPETTIEDVAIQTPLETHRIGRVENVVGLTRAKGWPIALVKSDLPDDVWWVQQMVGVQGTSFAARVNFGNEYSISGSEYHMVIVFLDSPDEVRRFRIAKQFKELPEGVRRSREFHYIRN